MEKKIINEKVVKGLMRCGDYHGANGCDYRQTSFGNYLYAIYYSALYNIEGSEDYKQGRIDLVIEQLEELAKSCIDKENMTITYDPRKYSDSPIGVMLPYVIHYVALKMGLDFAPEHKNYCTEEVWKSNEKVTLKLVECEPVNDKEMACSVVVAVMDNNYKLMENGGNNFLLRENEKLLNVMEDIMKEETQTIEQDKTK